MKNRIILLFLILYSATTYSQNYKWGLDLDYFFDNTEYDKSFYIEGCTMHGVWLSPQGGISWDKYHSINAGVNLFLIPGNKKTLEKVDLTIYYKYQRGKSTFMAGAFPRKDVLDNYDTSFFRDSINNYIPNMQGVFWQIGGDKNFINAWLDWTGTPSKKINESFFAGSSGRISSGVLFAEYQSYMYHRANTKPATDNEGVSENLQLQAMAGAQFETPRGFKALASAGTLIGYERDRRFGDNLYKPAGFVARLQAEYWGFGTKNSLYIGDERMIMYNDFGSNLYFGNQFLRGNRYLKSEWYIKLIEGSSVNIQFNNNLHLSEGKVFFQQMLTVSATIGNIKPKHRKDTNYPWKQIFK